jgi:hypothetical protein
MSHLQPLEAWIFTDERRTKALLIPLNHLNLSKQHAFVAKLRWFDHGKTYLVEDFTGTPHGDFAYACRFLGRGDSVYVGGQAESS